MKGWKEHAHKMDCDYWPKVLSINIQKKRVGKQGHGEKGIFKPGHWRKIFKGLCTIQYFCNLHWIFQLLYEWTSCDCCQWQGIGKHKRGMTLGVTNLMATFTTIGDTLTTEQLWYNKLTLPKYNTTQNMYYWKSAIGKMVCEFYYEFLVA